MTEPLVNTARDTAAQPLKELLQFVQIADDLLRMAAENRGSLAETLAVWYTLKDFHKQIDDARKILYHLVDRYEKSVLPGMFDANGTDLVRVPYMARSFYPNQKYSASVADPEKLKVWLRERGDGHIIVETVNASTLAAHLKDLLQNQAVEAPEDVCSLKAYYGIGSSKYTPKSDKVELQPKKEASYG